MNLTRDSIKRNAHPAYIAWILSSALPESTSLVLNADDLIASSIGAQANPRTHFSVDALPTDGVHPQRRGSRRRDLPGLLITGSSGSTGGSTTSARRSARHAASALPRRPTGRARWMPRASGSHWISTGTLDPPG